MTTIEDYLDTLEQIARVLASGRPGPTLESALNHLQIAIADQLSAIAKDLPKHLKEVEEAQTTATGEAYARGRREAFLSAPIRPA